MKYEPTPIYAAGSANGSGTAKAVLTAAVDYTRRGWSVLPLPFRSKNPGYNGWQLTRLTEPELPAAFGATLDHETPPPRNLGVLTGEPSDWLADVDLDHPRCVARADEFLPQTPCVFGRRGKPRSHRLFRLTRPFATKKFKSRSAGMLVELRTTGLQTVFPPSVHENGEPIEWEPGAEEAEPTLIDPDELLTVVIALANSVKVELGERSAPKPEKAPREAETKVSSSLAAAEDGNHIERCVQAMLRMSMSDGNDGSSRLYAAACRAVEHDLSDVDALTAVRQYAEKRPFPTDWTDEQILARVRDAEGHVDRGVIGRATSEGKAKVLIDPDEHRVVNETVAALAADDTIYQRGGVLVRVLRERAARPDDDVLRPDGSPTITFLPQAALRERMTKHAQFVRLVRRGDLVQEVPTHPTNWLVGAVDARGEWPGIRHLAGISDVPVLRADGSLWQTPGHDARTGVLYEPAGVIPVVADDVTIDDADAAVGQLLEVVFDFRFENDDHRAAWLAAMLTPLARFAFEGPAPLFLIDANVRGAGKGLLAQTIGQVALGREMPVSSYAHDPEEMRKKITAIALAGDRVIHLDNLEGSFGNDTLDRALTATRWKDRILGKSQEVELPLIPVWYGTGNNVAVAADTTRRIIHVRLDVLEERPEERRDFRHPELVAWVRANRGRLLAAAFTILKAYCNAGMPRQGLTPFGSFEGWSRLVREAVVWAGLPDPCRTRTRLAESADTTADALGQLLSAWPRFDPHDRGFVVSEALARLYAKDFAPRDDAAVAMRAALENLVGCPPGRAPTPRQVGAKLKSFRRRVCGGRYIDCNPNEHNRNGAVWRLHDAAAGDDVGAVTEPPALEERVEVYL